MGRAYRQTTNALKVNQSSKQQKGRRQRLFTTVRLHQGCKQRFVFEHVSDGVNRVLLHKYEIAMKTAAERALLPGCASVALRHGRVVHAQASGYADLEAKVPFRLDTICRIFCMTKTYVIVVFMMLVEEGRVRLEDPVAKFLPAFKDIKVVGTRSSDEEHPAVLCKPKRVMRMIHLLTHSSGLSYGTGFGEEAGDATEKAYEQLLHDSEFTSLGHNIDLAEFTDRLAKIPLRSHPGDKYSYGFSTDVLGRVLEVITGQTLEECLHQRLFAPLGMHDTSFSVPPEKLHRFAACYGSAKTWGKLYGKLPEKVPHTSRPGLIRLDGDQAEDSAWYKGRECRVQSGGGIIGRFQGGLVSTVADTCQFATMLARRGVALNGQRLLKEETVAAMEAARKEPGLAAEERHNLLGTFQGLSGEEFGTGGAACTYWSVDRKEDNALVWFSQHVDMSEWRDQHAVNEEEADLWTVLYKATRPKPLHP